MEGLDAWGQVESIITGDDFNNLKKMRFVNKNVTEEVTDDIKTIEELTVAFYDALCSLQWPP